MRPCPGVSNTSRCGAEARPVAFAERGDNFSLESGAIRNLVLKCYSVNSTLVGSGLVSLTPNYRTQNLLRCLDQRPPSPSTAHLEPKPCGRTRTTNRR